MTLTVNDSGDVLLPAELIQASPDTKLEAERQGGSIIVRVAGAEPVPHSTQESILDLPIIRTEACDSKITFRRVDIYGDDGR